MKLADVLWRAANVHLAPTSCNAVSLAANDSDWRTRPFLRELGCDTSTGEQLPLICGFENGSDALQGVRYMWLLLAMCVAEDEGIEL